MRHERIIDGEPDLFSDEIFVFIDNNTKYSLETETVPAGTYMSMCCRVFEEEKNYALLLFEELQKSNIFVKKCRHLTRYVSTACTL